MRLKRGLQVLLIAGVTVWGVRAHAHHQFSATYGDQDVTVEGEVAQVLFRNPHSFLHLLAPARDGTMTRWTVEWVGAGLLGSQGVTKATVKPGDHVIITGNPGRNPNDHRLYMKTIVRPRDGWRWRGEGD